jgi:hypothetical protein
MTPLSSSEVQHVVGGGESSRCVCGGADATAKGGDGGVLVGDGFGWCCSKVADMGSVAGEGVGSIQRSGIAAADRGYSVHGASLVNARPETQGLPNSRQPHTETCGRNFCRRSYVALEFLRIACLSPVLCVSFAFAWRWNIVVACFEGARGDKARVALHVARIRDSQATRPRD